MKNWVITKNLIAAEQIKDPVKFRLLDDDGIVYFEGLIERKTLFEGGGDEAFAPLDWAEGRYGCTEMQYREGTEWETL